MATTRDGRLLDGALDRIAGLAPYLDARRGIRCRPQGQAFPPAEGEWVRGLDWTANRPLLRAVIRSTGAGIGTSDDFVSASLFVQGYSYRVLVMAVGCLCSSLLLPDSSAGAMAMAIRNSRPSLVGYLSDEVTLFPGTRRRGTLVISSEATQPSLAELIRTAVDAHVAPLIDAVQGAVPRRIGERTLWGNVASSAATAFMTMDAFTAGHARVFAERFFEMERTRLGAFGRIVPSGGTSDPGGWRWQRSNCCLHYQLPGNIRCYDCSLADVTGRT